ncbi:hypothetical protein COU74_00060 [Candidatus Peregrinibacteria bacterium CG10_big_fil_rev_8_21_14_0_10_36_19]|nr:MAG: hypothetical protein COU74_00060 [Candidatus Peregrinibacteria bacterium CG10_big_fil_rev_8_21_14_0_10_36_19]
MSRISLKIIGQSGAGLLSVGEIVTQALVEMGFDVVADREYPSLIKGGHSCFVIDFSKEDIFALCGNVDVMVAIDKPSMEAYYKDLKDGGIFIHGYERQFGIKKILEDMEARGCKTVYVPTRETAISVGGNILMQNIVLVGMLWKVLGFDYKFVQEQVEKKFASKPKLLELDLRCLKAGFDAVSEMLEIETPEKGEKKILIDGNHAIALGAVHCGVRAFYAYPMSPSSSILSHLANMASKTKMLVKQAEDEMTAVQMAIGSMYMGTRAFTATSGGGFDLMTESLSLAGIIENPLVIVVAQRPGPGTGLPTWTLQGDLNIAMYSGHGEFPRVVIGVSEPTDCFELIQHAFNLAEVYQTPVILLTEKVICESKYTVERFKQNSIKIERGLVEGDDLLNLKGEDRYSVSSNGVSQRWMPGSSEAYYFANGDEHWERGELTEDAEKAKAMQEKRMKKVGLIKDALPEPIVYGEKDADISFIGWGSSKNVMNDVVLEAAKQGVKVNYLHYSYVMPLKEEAAIKFFKENKKVCLIENNFTGQFGNFIEAETGLKFADRLLKYDGRPFFVNDVLNFIHGK